MNRILRSLICIVLIFVLSMNFLACGRIVESSRDDDPEEEELSNVRNKKKNNDDESDGKSVVEPGPGEEAREAVFLQPYARMEGDQLKYGYTDPSGKIAIEPVYKHAEPFCKCGLAPVTDMNGRMGLIDTTGKYVVDPEWDIISYSDGAFLCYKYDGRYSHVYNEDGTFMFEFDGYASKVTEGFIQSYSGNLRGYLNKDGDLVIKRDGDGPLGDFLNGIAEVADYYFGPTYYIDKNGNDLTNSVSSGLRMYKDENSELFGFMNDKGDIVIPASFSEATPFLNGYAIVNVSDIFYDRRYGVIDTSGNFVLDPVYCGYTRLSNGLVALGEKISDDVYLPYEYYDFSKKALFTPDFKKSTDWLYYSVTDLDNENVCVYDGKNTYFIDKTLSKAGSLPEIEGFGKFVWDNDLLRGEYNGKLTVIDRKGGIVSRASGNIDFGDFVAEKNVRIPTPAARIAHPAITGMKDKGLQDRINARLFDDMVTPYEFMATFYGPEDTTWVESDYSIARMKDLLMIDQYIYTYYLGAAHGLNFRNTAYIDLTTGVQYGLKDLFREDDQDIWYLLSTIVTAQMQDDEEIGYFEDKLQITPESPFALYTDSIGFYYGQGELAGYAAGIVEFQVPFYEISDHIDTEGAFWRSFN